MGKGKRIYDLVPSVALSVVLIVLNVLRIIRIPITIDETGYVPTEGYWETMYKKYPSANNHILHSLFRKFFIETFNDGVFFYRIDLLIAQLAFYVFSYKLMQQLFKSGWMVFAGFASLALVSPWVFEFWGLSRGYGWGLMSMVGSIYLMVRYFEQAKLRTLMLSISLAALSVYSNFSFLNVYGGIIASFLIVCILLSTNETKRPGIIKQLLAIALPTAVLALLIVKPLMMVQSGGELNFLGAKGFKNDTVTSVLKCALYKSNESGIFPWVVRLTYYGTLVFSLFWIYALVQRQKFTYLLTELRTGVFLHLLLIMPFLAQVAQFHLLHINYLIDRAAMFFLLLYVIQLVYFFYFLHLAYSKNIQWAIGVVTLLLGGFFFSHVNLNRTFLWWYEEDDLKVLEKMASLTPPNSGKQRIWLDWQFVPAFTYDVIHFYPNRFSIIDNSRTLPIGDTSFQFLYIRPEDIPNVAPCYEKVGEYCGGGAFKLYAKKK